MICELVALSCLVAHGDMKSLQSHKVGKAYSAEEIINKLAALRPHFYPIPVKQRLTNPEAPMGKRIFELKVIEPSPLPKEGFLTLYGKTHRHLHRGSLKKLMSTEIPIDMNSNFRKSSVRLKQSATYYRTTPLRSLTPKSCFAYWRMLRIIIVFKSLPPMGRRRRIY